MRTSTASREIKDKLELLHQELQLLQAEISKKNQDAIDILGEQAAVEGRIYVQWRRRIPNLVISLVQAGGWIENDEAAT